MTKIFQYLIVSSVVALLIWDGQWNVSLLLAKAAEEDQPQYSTVLRNHLKVAVSLVWEGDHMHQHDIEAIKKFRREFTDISLIHFVSPAYFLRSDQAENLELFRSTLQKHDHVGVLVSGWRSVIDASEVPMRVEPTFWGQTLSAASCLADCGADIPLSSYAPNEIKKIVAASRDILFKNGLGTPVAAMIAGWNTSPSILNALSQAGIRYDFSAVPPELLQHRLQMFPLFNWIKAGWPQVTTTSQPYVIATDTNAITEIPQNFAAMDYVTTDQTIKIFADFQRKLHNDPNADLVLQFSVNQETAKDQLPKLAKSIQSIFSLATESGINLKHLSLPETGVRDKYALEPLRFAPPGHFVH